ncbi:MAG TPA: Spy/CpxP family protein refolding chaperone [Bryobacteraceae bacterium]|nr:Spy/CpxP family protein refolding chaperone [Bryobacteraceae bacterium]
MKLFGTKILILTTAATLTAGALLAAVPHNRMNRLTTQLGLSTDQQAQAKSIFSAARQTAQPIRTQLRQERQAVQQAIQAGQTDQQVQQLASAEGPQLAQLAAIRASAFAKFYATLTPSQQQKLQALHEARGHRAQQQ